MEAHTDWTEEYGVSGDVRGLDHLSLESTAENIYDQVTPGFTNLAKRARYYALYCWILYDYFNGGHEREEFTLFFRRREHAYALACLSHAHRPGAVGEYGIMGSMNATRHWRSGQDPLDLSQSHIKSRLGGYGLYYRNAMQRAGLIQLVEGQERLTESSYGTPSGRALAEAFQDVIEDTTYFKQYRDEYHVPRSVLEEYGRAACVCEMAEAPDGGVLRQTLLQPEPPEADAAVRGVHLARTKTLALIFDVLNESSQERMDDMAWRNLLFYGSFSQGISYAPPEKLSDVALIWRMYQQRELHVYSLTSLWVELLSWLEERRSAALEEWIEELDSSVDLAKTGNIFGLGLQSGRPSEVTIGELLDAVSAAAGVGAFGDDLTELIEERIGRDAPASERAIHASLDRRELPDPGDYVAAALWHSLVLYARTRHWVHSDPAAANLTRIGDARHWSIESYFGEVDRRRQSSALEFFAWIYRNLVRQHLTVAMSKLPLDTFMLFYEDGALHHRASDWAQFTADRYGTIMTVSRDLGWIEEAGGVYRLTALGEKGRTEALRVLS